MTSLPQSSLKIAVLGIGTELTSGQILNRNGQWISQRLKDLGVQTSCHLVVPDDRGLIRDSLQFCLERADILFVTGGLGPTSDDFTREVISQWTGKPLIFHPPSWKHIEERLASRGIVVREAQRQQCYYPEGSTIIFNKNGTANAFSLSYQNKDIYVLPGPPLEIETVWTDFIAAKMSEKTSHIDRYLTRSWDCIGAGESEIAFLAEGALKDISAHLDLEIAYRVHQPYVEFKVSFFESQHEEIKPWLSKIDEALKAYWVLKDNQDAAQMLVNKIAENRRIIFVDAVTGARLIQRVFPFAKRLLAQQQVQFCTEMPTAVIDSQTLILQLAPAGSEKVVMSMVKNSQTKSEVLDSATGTLFMKERKLQYFTELALLFWIKNLN
jgi:nicotinamide-nucleotide amidase